MTAGIAQPRPAFIDTPQGKVMVAGADEGASCAVYDNEEAATKAVTSAVGGAIAVLKRYGLYGLIVTGARSGDTGGRVSVSASVHGDGQFVGTALNRLLGLTGWREAAAQEAGAKPAADRPHQAEDAGPEKIWTCKIGGAVASTLPSGSDAPMRKAVEQAFWRLTGREAGFCFSGWNGELDEGERAVIEDREPDPAKVTAAWPIQDGTFMCQPDMALRHARIAHAMHVAQEEGDDDPHGTLDLFCQVMREDISIEDFESILRTGERAHLDAQAPAGEGEA